MGEQIKKEIVIIILAFLFVAVLFITADKESKPECFITSVEHGAHGIYANWIIDGRPYSQLLDHKEYLKYLYKALEAEYVVHYNIFVLTD